MNEVSSQLRMLLASHGRKRTLLRSFRLILLTPSWRGRGADSEEKQEPAGQLELWRSGSLNALDLNRPNREGFVNLWETETGRE